MDETPGFFDELPPPPPAEAASSTPPPPAKPIKTGSVRWGLLGFLFLLVLIIVVAFQNPQLTEFRFLAWKTPEVPVYIVILGTAVIAILLDELFGIFWRLRRRRRRKAAERAAS